MSTHERKASVREFYGKSSSPSEQKTKHSARSRYADATAMKPCFFFAAAISPSLMQLRDGVSDVDDRRQKAVCTEMMKMAARSGRFLRLRLKERMTVAFAWR
jgi:hypothetical protein